LAREAHPRRLSAKAVLLLLFAVVRDFGRTTSAASTDIARLAISSRYSSGIHVKFSQGRTRSQMHDAGQREIIDV